ncbi:TIGR03668 family PPOX class F420-dependent oxidoreductase, partial [Micromonospora aurantiaca]|nr:TIGR03668 family PPOX class F420-dependent oxidoreductase [Micromonospora aurantiaca]
MILRQDEMRRRIAREHVVRLATIDERGRAHVVPVIFAVDGNV